MKKSTCNLKKYHILRFTVLILVCGKKKKNDLMFKIFFLWFCFLKKFYTFLLLLKIGENDFYLFSKNCSLFHSIFKKSKIENYF